MTGLPWANSWTWDFVEKAPSGGEEHPVSKHRSDLKVILSWIDTVCIRVHKLPKSQKQFFGMSATIWQINEI